MKKGSLGAHAAKVYHPDVAQDKFDPEVFKEILEAYETLSDPNRKQTYDLGLTNPAFTEEDIQRHSQNIKENNYSRTFYLNKLTLWLIRWYNFKKPEEDLRFEYTEKTQETWIGKAFGNLYFKIGFVLAIIIGYDLSQYLKKKRVEDFNATKEKIFGYDQELTEDLKKIEEYVLARELAIASPGLPKDQSS